MTYATHRTANRPLLPSTRRGAGAPRLNIAELAMVAVAGEVVPPTQTGSLYRIGRDGVPQVLPGPGGIVLNHRVGDPCVGLAADHLEPGASVMSRRRALKGRPDADNRALNTYACIGNVVRVLAGACRGSNGVVTGKHGGVDHLLVDFEPKVLRRLAIGDKVQIYAYGLGLRLLDHRHLTLFNCSPRLVNRWGLRRQGEALGVPVTHLLPAAVMGSGLGRDSACHGDYDIQLFDPGVRRRYRLGSLRFGDLVAVRGADSRFGRSFHRDFTTIGVVVHGDSIKSGHGPGLVSLISGPATLIRPLYQPRANLAGILGLREPAVPASRATLLDKLARNAPRTRITQGLHVANVDADRQRGTRNAGA